MRRTLPARTRFTLYASSLGNYFFREVREILAAGLEESGMRVALRDETLGFDSKADWHVVVAPHEFFVLGAGAALAARRRPARLVLYNTEQMDSKWFPLARRHFAKARAVWDIDAHTSRCLAAQGSRGGHAPLGFSKACRLFRPVRRLPDGPATASLDHAVLGPPPERWEKRPIDILFQGSLSRRRGEFFSRAARELSAYRTFIHLSDPSRPVIPGRTTAMDSSILLGLAQRAKIVLNIHARQSTFFEWHRVALHGVAQGALVVSEPCTDPRPLAAGSDFVEASLEDIPKTIRLLLDSGEGRMRAAEIARRGRRTYAERCRMRDILSPLLEGLAAGRALRPPEEPPVVFRSREELPATPAEVLFRRGGRGPAPKATVAVTLFNYRRYLADCLESVRAQTAPLDLVVVDDASTDGSAEAARRWLERRGGGFRRSLLLRHRDNAGVSAARNTAFEAARTPYVFVLDADNVVFPPCVERLAGVLDRTGADFAYCLMSRFGEENSVANTRPWSAEGLTRGNFIDAMALVRKSSWEALGGYRAPTGTQGWEDYDLWLRLARAGGRGVQVPEILAAYRVHLSSMVHSETNPNGWRLEARFREAFSGGNGGASVRGKGRGILRAAMALFHEQRRKRFAKT